MTRAIIYIPSDAFEPHASMCMQYCEARGYTFEGLVRDDWPAVQRMFDNDEASVAIVSEFKHLDPNRKPRVEVVADQPPAGQEELPIHRRTRIIRPGGEV